jgi:hypothetical protein
MIQKLRQHNTAAPASEPETSLTIGQKMIQQIAF